MIVWAEGDVVQVGTNEPWNWEGIRAIVQRLRELGVPDECLYDIEFAVDENYAEYGPLPEDTP